MEEDKQKVLELWTQNAEKIKKLVRAKRARVKQLQDQHAALDTQEANLKFDLEKDAFRKMGPGWFIIILCTIVLFLHCFNIGAYLFMTLTGYAFLSNWRLLYVKHSPLAQKIAIAIIAATIWFTK